MFHVPNKYRVRSGVLGSDDSYLNNGVFILPHYRISNYVIRIQASDGSGWEHVSVSIAEKNKQAKRCPTWEEMCYVKQLFWDGEDCVVQYHPAESEYVNCHEYVLHLWRPIQAQIPTPNKYMVG